LLNEKKLSHAGPKTVDREAEQPAPTAVGSGDWLCLNPIMVKNIQ
jgi:hypothetical protein